MNLLAGKGFLCTNSVPSAGKIRRPFETGHVSLIVFYEVRKSKFAASFEGSPVRCQLNAQSGVTKDRYRAQGRLLWLLAMEDVHALVRAVTKTQTEFGIKHFPTPSSPKNGAKQAASMLHSRYAGATRRRLRPDQRPTWAQRLRNRRTPSR